MAPEKPKKENFLSKMTTKQKVLSGILVLVVIIIIWQVGLIGHEATAPTAPKIVATPAKTVAMTPTGPPSSNPNLMNSGAPTPPTMGQPPTMANPAMAQQPLPNAQEQPPLKEAVLAIDNQLLEMQKKNEEEYVKQLNELQMLKIQREKAETNQAIAAARLATATAEKNVSDLITRPSTPVSGQNNPALAPTSSVNLEAQLLQAEGGMPIGPPPASPAPPPAPTPILIPEVPYSVVSVSMQFGHWNAVLVFQNKAYTVSVGDILPPDGSVVTSINKNGVVLYSKNRKHRRLSIMSSI